MGIVGVGPVGNVGQVGNVGLVGFSVGLVGGLTVGFSIYLTREVVIKHLCSQKLQWCVRRF